ncbi:MAG: Ldh family oxidoreductase [Armatimonadota bacterium]|nr:MAG: Ldh family oxidoreductase [Armatimonadota bacterium]
MNEVTYVAADALRDACSQILEAVDVRRDEAALIADCLVYANLRGVDTHGIIRLKFYLQRIAAGGDNPRAQIKIVRESATTALLDADNAFGTVAGVTAMDLAIAKARDSGVGVTVIRNANHFGVAAYYAARPLREGMIGVCTTNVVASMPPPGGRAARVGNSPIAITFPSGEEPPVIFDAATSVAPWGALIEARLRGEQLPPDSFLDSDGGPTRDPQAVLDGGFLLPIAGHKGYGLALSVALLTGLLGGGVFDTDIMYPYGDVSVPGSNSFLMLALRVESFVPLEEYTRRMDDVIRLVRATPTAEGVERVLLPGQREHETAQERARTGIPLSREQVDELQGLAASVGVSLGL